MNRDETRNTLKEIVEPSNSPIEIRGEELIRDRYIGYMRQDGSLEVVYGQRGQDEEWWFLWDLVEIEGVVAEAKRRGIKVDEIIHTGAVEEFKGVDKLKDYLNESGKRLISIAERLENMKQAYIPKSEQDDTI